MDDEELTQLALEIAQDSAHFSTDVNVDPNDTWITDLAEEYCNECEYNGERTRKSTSRSLHTPPPKHRRLRSNKSRSPRVTRDSLYSPALSPEDSQTIIKSILHLSSPSPHSLSAPSINIPPFIEEEQEFDDHIPPFIFDDILSSDKYRPATPSHIQLPPLIIQSSLPVLHKRDSVTQRTSPIPNFTRQHSELMPNSYRSKKRQKIQHTRYRSDILLETKHRTKRKKHVKKRARAVTDCHNEFALETEYGFLFVPQKSFGK